MVVCVLLCVLLGALLNGEATVLSSRVSVEEGKTLILRCTFPGRESAAMQWLTPKGYVTFFNSEKGAMDPLNNAPILGQRQGSPNTTKAAEITGEPPGTFLKDGRFQLIKSSGNRLVVSLSNVTGDDDGVYTCLHYGLPVKSKEVNVTVWAAPSKPLIEVTQITKHPKEVLVLNCSTVGGRPCPRITWLVGHTELSGNRKTTFIGDDDKKCAASSTLRINTFTHRSTVSCVVRHKGFSTGNSTTTFGFSDFLAASQSGTTTRDRTTDRTTGPTSHSAEVTTSVIDSELSSVQGNDVTTIRGGEEDLNTEMTSVKPPKTKMTWEPPRTGGDSENTTTGNQFTGGETSAPGDNTTQQNVTTETMTINGGNSTQNPELQNVTEIDCRRTGGFEASRGKSQSTVILVLVSLMVCVLLVIVHLFLIKLRKAHEAWKKDNENSDQNLESNKSKSNEDTPGPARNGHVTNPNGPGIKYNTQVSV